MKRSIITVTASVLVFTAAGMAFADYYKDGMSHYTKKNFTKAREYLLKAVEQGDRGNAYYFLGEIERNKSNFNQAEEYYEKAVASKTISAGYLKNAFWNLMALLERVQDHRKIVKACKGMWLRLKDGSARNKIDSIINKYLWSDDEKAVEKYRLGMSQKQNGNTADALTTFSEASSMDSKFLAPRFEMGMIYYKEGSYDKALNHLGVVAGKIDFYAEVHLICGDIQYQRDNYDNAIDHFNKASEYGIFDSETDYLIRTRRGTCYFQRGSMDKAMADFKAAIQLKKGAIQPYIMIAAIQTKEGEYTNAMKTLDKANKMQPDNPVILFQMGSIYYKQEDAQYLDYFDSTFDLIKSKEHYSEKYDKMVAVLITSHYDKKNYQRVTEILSFIPEDRRTADLIRIGARTYFNLKNYDKAADFFEKVSLGSDDKFTLSVSYARSGRIAKAKETLSPLLWDDKYLQKAKTEKSLLPVLKEIESDEKNKKIEGK